MQGILEGHLLVSHIQNLQIPSNSQFASITVLGTDQRNIQLVQTALKGHIEDQLRERSHEIWIKLYYSLMLRIHSVQQK